VPLSMNFLAYRFLPFDGYGRYGLHYIKAMQSLGVDVHAGVIGDFDKQPAYMRKAMGIDDKALSLLLMPPHEIRPNVKRIWNYTMYESTRVPEGWSDILNDTDAVERVIVPCEWCEEVFRNAGVKKPIHVVHGGTDPDENPVLPDRDWSDTPYTFVALGDRGTRKGWDIAYLAFCIAFPEKPKDVRLIIKSRPASLDDQLVQIFRDSDDGWKSEHIQLWNEEVKAPRDVFRRADCCVYPATADGWGMWCREAACSGLPVIATRYSGLAVDIDQWAVKPIEKFRIVDSSLLPSPDKPGKWAFPNVEEVAAHMRWCYDHRTEAREKGLQAAAWIRANATWEHSAKQLLALVDEYGA
jgi:glycosyltransferase involved in cell wall biosynthesis